MRRFRLMFIVPVVFMTLFFFGSCMNSAYSGLPAVKHNEIKKAYMNGFLAAIKIDIKELEEFKKIDNEALRNIVIEAGKSYMVIVEEMNASRDSRR